MQVAVLLPVKAFHEAKGRLRPALSESERARLAQWMAGRVVAAAAPHPVFVVCDDPAVAGWADSVGATVLWRPAHGLNAAVGDGFATLSGKGYDSIVVSHSDLPLATDLGRFADPAGQRSSPITATTAPTSSHCRPAFRSGSDTAPARSIITSRNVTGWA